MTVSVFNNTPRKQSQARRRVNSKMRSTTTRKFGGGWNVIDAPVGLSTRYANVLKNFYRKQDGSQSLRYGTQWKKNIGGVDLQGIPAGTTMQETPTGTEAVGDGVASGKNFAITTTLNTAGEVVRVYIEVDTVTTATTVICGIYSDNAGSPGALIGSASPAVTIDSPGIYEFIPVPGSVATGTQYWVVFTDNGGAGNFTVDVVADQGGVIGSGKHDTITSITGASFTSSFDLKALVLVDDVLAGTVIKQIMYLGTRLIAVTDEGELISIDASWNLYELFNEGIANSQNGAPDGWSNTFDLVTFTEMQGSMIICNGVDQPLEITDTYEARYLQDLGTGSNQNVPIAKYCTTVGDYLILAGIEGEESTIYVGSKGTIGTFFGDPTPNDAVNVDLGAYAPGDDAVIRGLSSFKNELYVHFINATLRVIIGEYESTDHVPRVEDTIQDFGILAHRTSVPLVNDLLFADVNGINTIKRNLLSDATEPDQLSELIAPEWQSQVAAVGGADDLQHGVWAIYDRLQGSYMVFVPTGVGAAIRGFIFTFNERMKIQAWSEFTGWEWVCGCTTALGRTFFAKDLDIYQYGNQAYSGEDFSGDYLDEYDAEWGTGTAYVIDDRILDTGNSTVYICVKAHTSGTGTFANDRTLDDSLWIEYEGDEIVGDWEFPWMDMGTRTKLKRLNNIRWDTYGTAEFTMQVFVDNTYQDENSAYDPALSMVFVAGDSGGYGNQDQPYGGGRRTADERRWSHPVKFVICKVRLTCSTNKPLRVVSMSMLYSEGRFGR